LALTRTLLLTLTDPQGGKFFENWHYAVLLTQAGEGDSVRGGMSRGYLHAPFPTGSMGQPTPWTRAGKILGFLKKVFKFF